MAKNKSDKDIIYGDVEISEEDLDIKKTKVRVNTWLDGDIVLELKSRAKNKNTKYQTMLNQILRSFLFNEKDELTEILDRLKELERKVG